MSISLDEMKKATELTREGRLLEATRILRRAMEGTTQAPDRGPADAARGRRLRGEEITDVAFRELSARTHERPRGLLPDGVAARAPQGRSRPATFETHRFASNGRTYAYRLYLPPRSDDRLLPVIVMLHGCTQDAADFATGTAMNELAAQRGCIVVYPEQLARSNSMRCWNWFDPSHQHRGRGEPAMIAALAAHVVQRCQGDPRRVYVAGLSAGGAMAALVAQLYPDVFAAVGVHSGLPAGAATDVPSAHAAMRRPARKSGGRHDIDGRRPDDRLPRQRGPHGESRQWPPARRRGSCARRRLRHRTAAGGAKPHGGRPNRAAHCLPRCAAGASTGALGDRRWRACLVGRKRRRDIHRSFGAERIGRHDGLLPRAAAAPRRTAADLSRGAARPPSRLSPRAAVAEQRPKRHEDRRGADGRAGVQPPEHPERKSDRRQRDRKAQMLFPGSVHAAMVLALCRPMDRAEQEAARSRRSARMCLPPRRGVRGGPGGS